MYATVFSVFNAVAAGWDRFSLLQEKHGMPSASGVKGLKNAAQF